ncbi:unnamed protein product [Closterium sp. NIES-54]
MRKCVVVEVLVVSGGEMRGLSLEGVEPGGAEPEGVEPGGAASEGAESGGAEPEGATSSGVSAGASPSLSPQQLHEWFVRRTRLWSGASGAGGADPAGAGGTGVAAGAGVTGAAGTGGVEGAGSGDLTESGTTCAGGARAGGAGVGGPGVGGAGAGEAGAVDPGGAVRPRRYSRPLHCVLLLLTPSSPAVLQSVMSLRLVLSCLFALLIAFLSLSRLLATAVSDPLFEFSAAALVAGLLDFAAAGRLDYATALVAESASVSPPSVGGECALGTDVLEDRQEDFECLASAVPRFASMLLAPEGDPDAPDIPTPRSYAEAITGTYINEVPPPGANIVDGMWILRVKRPPGSPPAFKARYVARGFSQRQGVDDFKTFSPTPKMTTLRVLLHVTAQRDYELHYLDFSIVFMQGTLHEEIWLRRPPRFTESFPAGTQWSLWRPVYGLHQAPREWHDTLRTTLAALGFAPSTAGPSLFLRTDTSLPPFYVLVYVDNLIFASAYTQALTLVNSEVQKRHICTDLGELRNYLGLQITRDRARRTITLTQSHMVHQVLQCFGFQFSSPQLTPCHSPLLCLELALSSTFERFRRAECTSGIGLVLGGRGPVVLTGHADASWVYDSATQRSSQGYTFSLGSGPVSWWSTRSSSVLKSSCEAEIYAGAMAAQELRWLTYLLTDLGEQPRSPPILYVDNKAMIALCQEHRLEHRMKHIAQ